MSLHRAGKDVIAVDQAFDAASAARLSGIRMVEGDLLQVLSSDAIGPCSIVIHGAAITASPERLGISRAAHIRRNIDLLTATLDFARDACARRFLFISSMGVFEPDDAPAPNGYFTEATHPTATCTYCAAKNAGELLTSSAAEDGFATLSLRLGNIFGPHEAVRETRQHLCLVSRMLAEARKRGVITVHTPEAMREWSWLPDLAGAIVRLLDVPWDHAPVLHAGQPPVISDLALARVIAALVPGTSMRLIPPPHNLIRPPMGTDHPSALGEVAWTTMEDAIAELMQVEAAQ